jgi:hypothetical protein
MPRGFSTLKRCWNRPEDAIQRALLEHLNLRHVPGVYWFHVGNGGHRMPIEAKGLKSRGVRAGVPESGFLIRDGKTYGGVGGRLTPVQRTAHLLLRVFLK